MVLDLGDEAKKRRREKEFKKNVEAFMEDYNAIVEEHGIALVPIMQRTQRGNMVGQRPQDVSDQIEARKGEAVEKVEEKLKGKE